MPIWKRPYRIIWKYRTALAPHPVHRRVRGLALQQAYVIHRYSRYRRLDFNSTFGRMFRHPGYQVPITGVAGRRAQAKRTNPTPLRCVRSALRSDREFTGIGFEQLPSGGARLVAPICVKGAEAGAKTARISGVDRHAMLLEFRRPGGVDCLGVLALQ
jgi:hypothetical protein